MYPQDYESDEEEERAWNRFALEQFFLGFAESDSIYDAVEISDSDKKPETPNA